MHNFKKILRYSFFMGIAILAIQLFYANKSIPDHISTTLINTTFVPPQEDTNELITYGDKMPSSTTVTIVGTSDDAGIFKRPNFINNTYLFGKSHQNMERQIHDDVGLLKLHDIQLPMLMEFSPSGDRSFHDANIYLLPNDTISFEVKNEQLVFTGKNAAIHNFSLELDANTPDYSKSHYQGDLILYKEEITNIYEKKKAFLETYIQKYTLPKEFIEIYRKLLQFEYYNNLVSPRMKKYDDQKLFFNTNDILPTLIQNEKYHEGRLFDVTSYLDNLTVADFQDDIAMRNTHFFKNSLTAYARYHFVQTEATPFSKEYMMAEKAFIEDNFKGVIKDYAIGRMIWDYYNKGFAYGSENIAYMVETIDEYLKTVGHKKTFRDKMEDIREDILLNDFKLSESALNATLVNHVGDTITLQDIFNRSKKRVKVVDFWASWCPPCVAQIQESKPFKDRLSVENNVEWIYLSIDTDREKWLKKGAQLRDFLHFRNSYLLVNGKKSPLAKFLHVHEIPRYVVFDKNNMVLINSAPSPSDEVVFEKIIDQTQVATPIQ